MIIVLTCIFKAIMTNGVLLFADVSGFTALTERYSNHREGVSGLTFALNEYIRLDYFSTFAAVVFFFRKFD